MLWFMGSQRVGHDWLTELNWKQTYLQIYRVRKANLVTDYRLVKVKVKHRSDQTCSLFSLSSLFSGKKKKKKSHSFFSPFHCSTLLFIAVHDFPGHECPLEGVVSLLSMVGSVLLLVWRGRDPIPRWPLTQSARIFVLHASGKFHQAIGTWKIKKRVEIITEWTQRSLLGPPTAGKPLSRTFILTNC